MVNKIILFLVIFIILFIYRSWFSFYPLASGDWLYQFPQTLASFPLFPFAWEQTFNNGLGGNLIFLLAHSVYFTGIVSILFNLLHIPWIMIERALGFWPFILLSATGSFFLFRKIFGMSPFAYLTSIIYTTNTYALMLGAGGQIGVGLGYALAPFVFLTVISMIKSIEEKKVLIINSFYAGIAFAVQLMFDPRIAYVTLFGVFFYVLSFFLSEERKKLKFLSVIIIITVPLLITSLLHFFWLLPFALVRQNPLESLGIAFTEIGIVKFLSFATFENTLSLLHPNWPENIFGKVGFMKSEFLLIPIIAFSSLLFMRSRSLKKVEPLSAHSGRLSLLTSNEADRHILFFCIIALISAFLAKGTQEPFGVFYLWAFDTIPGFQMFRDSTKWYTLIVISYSLLIPFSLWKISNALQALSKSLKKLNNINFHYLFLFLFICFWLFTLRPVFLGQITGTFKPKDVPQNYVALTKFLNDQSEYSRTLWFPAIQQYSYYSTMHPMLSARELFQDSNLTPLANKIASEKNISLLREASIKYVIIPEDTGGAFFLKDRQYDEKTYENMVKILRDSPSLIYLRNFGKIVVFEVPDPQGHFWVKGKAGSVQNSFINATKYAVRVKGVEKGDILVFSENFDSHWVLIRSGKKVDSKQYNKYFNSFQLPDNGDYELTIYYEPQKWVDLGLIISGVSFVVLLGSIAFLFIKTKKHEH